MAHGTFAAFFGFVGEDGDLLRLAVFHDFGRNLSALHNGGADDHTLVLAYCNDFVKGDGAVCFCIQLLHINNVAYGYAILFAAGFDDCVHKNSLFL